MKTAEVALAIATAGLFGGGLASWAAGRPGTAMALVAVSFACALAGLAARLIQEIRN